MAVGVYVMCSRKTLYNVFYICVRHFVNTSSSCPRIVDLAEVGVDYFSSNYPTDRLIQDRRN